MLTSYKAFSQKSKDAFKDTNAIVGTCLAKIDASSVLCQFALSRGSLHICFAVVLSNYFFVAKSNYN